jgi:hypothetical protein
MWEVSTIPDLDKCKTLAEAREGKYTVPSRGNRGEVYLVKVVDGEVVQRIEVFPVSLTPGKRMKQIDFSGDAETPALAKQICDLLNRSL